MKKTLLPKSIKRKILLLEGKESDLSIVKKIRSMGFICYVSRSLMDVKRCILEEHIEFLIISDGIRHQATNANIPKMEHRYFPVAVSDYAKDIAKQNGYLLKVYMFSTFDCYMVDGEVIKFNGAKVYCNESNIKIFNKLNEAELENMFKFLNQ
jgi:hypothetical protein